MKAPRTDKEAARVLNLPATTRTLAAAGIVGPVLFTVGILVQQFYRRGDYDPVAQLVSDLTAGRYGVGAAGELHRVRAADGRVRGRASPGGTPEPGQSGEPGDPRVQRSGARTRGHLPPACRRHRPGLRPDRRAHRERRDLLREH